MIAEGSLLAVFVAASCRGTMLMGLLLAFRLLFRRQIPARILAAAWIVVALVWVVPLAIPVGWSPFKFAPRPAVNPTATEPILEPKILRADPSTIRLEVVSTPVGRAPAASATGLPPVSPASHPGWWLTIVWLGTAGVVLLVRGVSIIRFDWRLRRGSARPGARVTRALDAACAELRLLRAPKVMMTDLVSSPALCGVVRARLLFPIQLATELTEVELRWVMLHELGHYQRRDLWTLNLLHLSATIQWFNPFAWLAIRLGMHDAELACDEFVLRHTEGAEPREYGGVLLKVLSAQRMTGSLPAAVGIVENKRQLLRRFAMITNFRPASVGRAAFGVALLCGFALIGATQERPADKGVTVAPGPMPSRAPALNREQAIARGKERLARIIEWEEHANLALRAVGEVGGVPLAIVDVEGEPVLVNRQAGIMGLRIGEIDLATKQVTVVTRSGNARVLTLKNPETTVFPKVVPERFLTPQAQARRRDSMRGEAFPHQLVLAWPKINREGKLAILMSYLQDAEVLQIFTEPFGSGLTVGMGFLFTEQLQAQSRERRDRFIASLTPEQKAEFSSSAARAILLLDPPDKIQQQMNDARQAEAKRAKIIASLTPAQKTLYDEWMVPSQGAQRPNGPR